MAAAVGHMAAEVQKRPVADTGPAAAAAAEEQMIQRSAELCRFVAEAASRTVCKNANLPDFDNRTVYNS